MACGSECVCVLQWPDACLCETPETTPNTNLLAMNSLARAHRHNSHGVEIPHFPGCARPRPR
eukprot:7099007-Alexandrium_andersonii.AAC.1